MLSSRIKRSTVRYRSPRRGGRCPNPLDVALALAADQFHVAVSSHAPGSSTRLLQPRDRSLDPSNSALTAAPRLSRQASSHAPKALAFPSFWRLRCDPTLRRWTEESGYSPRHLEERLSKPKANGNRRDGGDSNSADSRPHYGLEAKTSPQNGLSLADASSSLSSSLMSSSSSCNAALAVEVT